MGNEEDLLSLVPVIVFEHLYFSPSSPKVNSFDLAVHLEGFYASNYFHCHSWNSFISALSFSRCPQLIPSAKLGWQKVHLVLLSVSLFHSFSSRTIPFFSIARYLWENACSDTQVFFWFLTVKFRSQEIYFIFFLSEGTFFLFEKGHIHLWWHLALLVGHPVSSLGLLCFSPFSLFCFLINFQTFPENKSILSLNCPNLFCTCIYFFSKAWVYLHLLQGNFSYTVPYSIAHLKNILNPGQMKALSWFISKSENLWLDWSVLVVKPLHQVG